MKFISKSLAILSLSLSTLSTFAAPTYFTTHNNTDEESNAFIAGTIPSPYPTAKHSTRQVYWNMVRIACYGHSSNGQCAALIKMATNTANPITVGTLSMDLTTGEITPKQLSAEGYTVIVNGPGEATITKD